MSDEAAVWKRLDEHSVKIDTLVVEQATTRAEVRALERRLDKTLCNITDTLSRMEAKQDNNTAYQNKQKGAYTFGAWVFGVSVTIIAVVATVWSNVFGS